MRKKEKAPNIFFTSDTHFGGDDTVVRENRPYKNAKAFERATIKKWNKQAKKDDIIYHLGDYINFNHIETTSWKTAFPSVKKIKAKVVLIIGNNEERIVANVFGGDFEKFREYCLNLGFADVLKEKFLEIDGDKFYLNHHPKKHKEGYKNIFGHTHRATGLWKPYGLNVGCDLNHFKLHSLNNIKDLFYFKGKWWDNDPDNLSM